MWKRICITLVLLIGGHHAVMTALYLLPKNPLTPRYRSYVSAYMEPLFEQRWQFFAPSPAIFSTKFWYRCGWETFESPWLDPAASHLEQHRHWRIFADGKILYIYQGLAREFINTYITLAKDHCTDPLASACLVNVQPWLEQTETYATARELAYRECTKHVVPENIGPLRWIQFQAVKVFPKQFSKRRDANALPISKIEHLESSRIKI